MLKSQHSFNVLTGAHLGRSRTPRRRIQFGSDRFELIASDFGNVRCSVVSLCFLKAWERSNLDLCMRKPLPNFNRNSSWATIKKQKTREASAGNSKRLPTIIKFFPSLLRLATVVFRGQYMRSDQTFWCTHVFDLMASLLGKIGHFLQTISGPTWPFCKCPSSSMEMHVGTKI